MSEQRQNEWEILEESAMKLLLNPESFLSDKKVNLLFRFWQFPSFERYKVWAIYIETGVEEAFLLQRVIWNRPSDSRRLSNPFVGLKQGFHTKPSISTKIKTLDSALINPYLEELFQINIHPVVLKDGLGVDGIQFGFEFRKFMANASFSWWCRAPNEWEELEKWFLKTKNFLDMEFSRVL
ncbi:MAG: hypothetical protein M3209_18880 [Acidobacteriota bacterium]|nr:hypothetical protein [Acidobacteriota bacterium]